MSWGKSGFGAKGAGREAAEPSGWKAMRPFGGVAGKGGAAKGGKAESFWEEPESKIGWGTKPTKAMDWEAEEKPASKGWKGGQIGPSIAEPGKGGKAGPPAWQRGPPPGKGFGKGSKGAPWAVQLNPDEELLWNAVTEAVQPIKHMEDELDESKLEKRIRDAFKKGVKGLSFAARPWQELVEEFADNALGSIFNSCGDKAWLLQIDMLLCLDAAVKDNFPPHVLRSVPNVDFEQCVLAAYERAFEEQRVMPILWDNTQEQVEGPKTRKKVYNALEAGFKEARVPPGMYPNSVQDFIACFIDRTIFNLAQETSGEPQYTLEVPQAIKLFDTLIAKGAVPFPLVQEHGPPPTRDPFVMHCIKGAYGMHALDPDGSPFGQGRAWKKKSGWKSKPRKPRKPQEGDEDYDPEAAAAAEALAEAEQEFGVEEAAEGLEEEEQPSWKKRKF